MKISLFKNHFFASLCCLATSISAPYAAAQPSIEIINYSSIKTSDIEAWTNAGAAHLSDWQADTLGVMWDLGRHISDNFSRDYPFNKHKVTLSKQQQSDLSQQVKQWALSSECAKDDYRAMEIREGQKNFDLWMKGGADVATAPDPCYDRRMVVMARTPNQDKDTVQQIWLHEFYHAHSNYLSNYCIDPNDPQGEDRRDEIESQRWFGEATAEHFAIMVSAQLKGTKAPVSDMLEKAHRLIKQEGTDIYSNLAGNSAVVLQLLIERGNIPNLADDAMSGAVFHSCDWSEKWNPELNEEVRFALNNWHKIKKSGGKWVFKPAALK